MSTRVAVVAASLDILGGQGVQAHALMGRLRDEGYEVDFVPINPRFPRWLRFIRALPWVRTALNESLFLPSLLRIRGADVVHVFSASYWSFLLAPAPAILAAKAFGKRVVLNYHSGEAEDHLKRWRRSVTPFLSTVDEIVVPSGYLRDVFRRFGYAARVIPNFVDTSRFSFRERSTLLPRLLSTRNLETHYQVDNTIRAFAVVKSRFPEATLAISGYGSEEARLRRLAGKIGGVTFLGRVEPRNMPRVYEQADIFLNSSVIDNQPISVLEAFASGMPVVSTPTGGLEAMVRDGKTGLVVQPHQPVAMAEAVTWILKNPEEALSMARRARAELEAHTWGRVRKLWAEAYDGAAA